MLTFNEDERLGRKLVAETYFYYCCYIPRIMSFSEQFVSDNFCIEFERGMIFRKMLEQLTKLT